MSNRSRALALFGPLFAVVLFSLLSRQTSLLYAFQVPPLPEGNLITNPWFRAFADPNDSALDGWTDAAGQNAYWSSSQKESNPSPDIVISGVCGNEPVYCGTSARLSVTRGQSGGVAQPEVDAYLYQVVEADPELNKLVFFTHWVSHRVEIAEASVYGSQSPAGPWTLLWIPFTHSQDEVVVPESGEVADLWEETGFLETTIAEGYSHYKVEFHARLPDGDGSGFKFTGVYFTVKPPSSEGTPTPTPTMTPEPQDDLLLLATALSQSQIELSLTDYAPDGSNYILQRSPDGVSGWTSVARLSPDTMSFVDEGLATETTYYYRAQTSGGARTSNVTSATTKSETEPSPTATPTTGATVKPTLTPTSMPKPTLKPGPTATPTATFTPVPTTKPSPTPTATPKPTLKPSPTAMPTATFTPSPTATATPTALPSPTPTLSADEILLSASALSSTQIELTWVDGGENERGYQIERSPNGVSEWNVVTRVPSDATLFIDEGLAPNTEYFYRLTTSAADGSKISNVASATTE